MFLKCYQCEYPSNNITLDLTFHFKYAIKANVWLMNVSQEYENMRIISLAYFYILMVEGAGFSEWLENIPNYTVSHTTNVKLWGPQIS